ncbi:MAG TPA: SDR family NAD(P)-dependent oxidoreductase, partial [Alphaproteobacteria bacterium]
LAGEGWIIAATARNAEALIDLQDTAPKGAVHCYPGDVANGARMKEIVGQILTHLGKLDLIILNAGILLPDNAMNFNAERFRRTIDTNLCGVANALDPALIHFRGLGQGHIVIVASIAGYMGLQGFLSYGPSKAALINFAQSLAMDLSDTEIKVQVVNPGYVATPMTQTLDLGYETPVPASVAAHKIIRGMKSSRFEITFPWSASYALKFVSCLPAKAAFFLLSRHKKAHS